LTPRANSKYRLLLRLEIEKYYGIYSKAILIKDISFYSKF